PRRELELDGAGLGAHAARADSVGHAAARLALGRAGAASARAVVAARRAVGADDAPVGARIRGDDADVGVVLGRGAGAACCVIHGEQKEEAPETATHGPEWPVRESPWLD